MAIKETHGETHWQGKPSKEYQAWQNMKARCYQASFRQSKDYAGRGITVCPAWRNSFQTFLSDMGRAPSPRHSLDRKNNNAGYSPYNCRWATPAQQTANKRRRCDALLTLADARKIRQAFTGVRGQQRVLAKQFGVLPQTICAIIHNRQWCE
jgi:hypothetical protein